MAKYDTQAAELELDEAALDDPEPFAFDEEEDDFMERSQRKLLRAKRSRPPRGRDWDY